MAKTSVSLGRADRLTNYFSYPNLPGNKEPLEATILH